MIFKNNIMAVKMKNVDTFLLTNELVISRFNITAKQSFKNKHRRLKLCRLCLVVSAGSV